VQRRSLIRPRLLFLQVLCIPSITGRIQIPIARSLSALTEEGISITVYGQMSSHPQKVISGIHSFGDNSFSTSNSFNNNSFNNIVYFSKDSKEEKPEIMQWLSPLEPQQRHQGVRASRLDGVGNWVLETIEFRKWRDAGDGCVEQMLFCYGNPGVGKTYVR